MAGQPQSGLSNIRESQVPTPTRATVEQQLKSLHGELSAAIKMDSPVREDLVRRRIDRKLEELHGLASVEEWGGLNP